MIQKSTTLFLLSSIVTSSLLLISCGQTTISTLENTDEISINSVEGTTKTISYQGPHGEISTSYTYSVDGNNTITSVSAVTESNDREDQMYAKRFNNASRSKIVGKKISDLSNLDAVGGASLTTEAFKQAIQK